MKLIRMVVRVGCAAVMSLGLTGLTNADELKVDQKRSRIQVDIKATGHSFTSDLMAYEAKVFGQPNPLMPEKFELSWKFNNLNSGDAKRDKEMMKWLGGDDSTGSFEFEKSWQEKDGSLRGMGKLTIHGVSKPVSFPFQAVKKGDWVTIDGSAVVNYQDFGLPIIRSMGLLTVDPKLNVRFHVVGTMK